MCHHDSERDEALFSVLDTRLFPELLTMMTLHFPVTKSPSPTWELSAEQLEDWRRLFPHVDVDSEVLKAYAWLDANPMRRKTARGMRRFLVAWLMRASPSWPPVRRVGGALYDASGAYVGMAKRR